MAKEQKERKPITFILLDGSVTTYGFRVLVEGVDTSQFERNPVMFYHHKDYNLPIGTWSDIRKENGNLLADANFDYDDPDPEVQRIIGKVERGIIKMASVSLRDPEASADDSYKIEGQTLPSIVKSRLREASIVAIGGNHNALKLYDQTDSLIDLSNNIKLADFFGSPKGSSNTNPTANRSKESDCPELIALKDKSYDELDRENKLLYLKDNHPDVYKEKYDEKFKSDSKSFKDKEKKEFESKSWDELDKQGMLPRLKKEYPDLYNEKYRAKFGKLPEKESKTKK